MNYIVYRTELGDGQTTVTLYAYDYLRYGGITELTPVASETVAQQVIEGFGPVVEMDTAVRLVHEHVGEHYTAVWQGRGWTVELRVGYPLWRVTC